MAQLKDTLILGDLNVTEDAHLAKIYAKILMAHQSDSSTIFSAGSAGQALHTDGTNVYWAQPLQLGNTGATAAAGDHTHTLSIASDSGTNQLSLTANTKYKLTAGGQTYIFTTPVDNNTTYTFTGGINAFTVTPSNGDPYDIDVTPSIANNITGTGTADYLTKFTGTNTIGSSGIMTDSTGSLFLTTIGGSVTTADNSRIYFGTPSGTRYSWLSSNTSGAFCFGRTSGSTSYTFTLYPNTGGYNCFMTNSGSNLGRNDTNGSYAWGSLYVKNTSKLYRHNGSNAFYEINWPSAAGTIALEESIPGAISSAIEALDGSITGTPSSTKTLTAFSQADGIVSATFSDITFPNTFGIVAIKQGSDTTNLSASASGSTVTFEGGDNITLVPTANSNKVKINAAIYIHPVEPGYIHIPSGGASGQYLTYGGTSGTAAWTNFPTTMTPSSHTHGSLSNDGKVSSTITTGINKIVVTNSSGEIKIADLTNIDVAPKNHQHELSDIVGNVVTYTTNTNVTVPGTGPTGGSNATKTITTYTYTPTAIYTPNGLIMGGTAQNAGLTTRGICGVSTPNATTGSATKENLYINYDGDNTYRSNRQVVLQAGTVGSHYGNNVYQYAVVRGDAMKAWVEAQGYLTSYNDTKQVITTASTQKNYITGVNATGYTSANAYEGYADTDVYLTTTPGQINATTYKINEAAIWSWDSALAAVKLTFV